MKAKIIIVLLLGLFIHAELQSQTTAIPDPNFEQALIDLGLDDVLDGVVLTANVENVTLLYVVDKGIQNLEGISAFINLKFLHCGQNSIVQLDFSENLFLEEIHAQSNSLENINIQNNTNLKVIALAENNLSIINLNQNTALEGLQLTDNSLVEIDISQNLSLRYLQIENNNLSDIDLLHNPSLEIVWIQNNNLDIVNTAHNPILESLNVSGNPISQLDLSNNPLLKVLIAGSTDVTYIDLSNLQLIGLELSDTKYTYLDVSNQTSLISLNVINNELTYLNIKNGNNQNMNNFGAWGNSYLSCIQVDDADWAEANWRSNVDFHTHFSENCGGGAYTLIPDNNFEQALIDLGLDDVLDGKVLTASVDTVTVLIVTHKNIGQMTGIEAFSSLKRLNCGFNNLINLDLTENLLIEVLLATNNELSSVNLENPNLRLLQLSDNNLSEIDISSCPALEELGCDNNQITEINLTSNSQLIGFHLDNNQLTTIDCTGNPLLYYARCSNNNLTSISFNNNSKLIDLICSHNNIVELDFGQMPAIERLRIHENSFISIDLTANPLLRDLAVFNNQLQFLNVKNGNNQNFTGFAAFNNPNLMCIQVDDPTWSEANWTYIDPQMYFSEFCGATAGDSDGDGVPDDFDDYPQDALRAFDNHFPAAGYGSLAFEDLWPGMGDYDFNDVVVDYRFKTVTNASNKVVEVIASFVLKASGASLRNGFGFNLPNASANLISQLNEVQVTGYESTSNFISLQSNGFEASQSKPTIIVFDDFFSVMEHPGIGLGINTEQDKPFVEFDTLTLLIKPSGTQFTLADFKFEQWNPFIIVNGERGKEIHLPNRPPTDLADLSLFGTYEDSSNPSSGRYYKTVNNLPWAINIVSEFVWPLEKVSIVEAYKHFFDWAKSAGAEFGDWYEDKTGYREPTKLYTVE